MTSRINPPIYAIPIPATMVDIPKLTAIGDRTSTENILITIINDDQMIDNIPVPVVMVAKNPPVRSNCWFWPRVEFIDLVRSVEDLFNCSIYPAVCPANGNCPVSA